MGRAVVVGLGAAVVAFAAGLSVGLVMGGGDESRDAGGAATETAAEPERETSGTTSAERETDTPRRRVGDGSTPIPDSLGAIDAEDLTVGDGVISGHVRLEDGTPIPGAMVRTYARPPSEWKRAERTAPLAERLEKSARQLRWDDATRREATTASDGSYALSRLVDGEHMVTATASGFSMRRALGSMARVTTGDTVDFVAKPQTTITFRIVGPGGVVPDEAKITFKSGNNSHTRGWRTSQTEHSLAPMNKTLIVTAGEFEELRSEPRPFKIEAGDKDRVVEVELFSRPGVGGRLKFEGPTPQNAARVRIMRIRTGSKPTSAQLLEAEEQAWLHGHNEYRFSFHDLSPGTYALGVGREYDRVDAIEIVEVGDEFARVEIAVPDYDRNACIEILALSPDGVPVTEFQVTLSWKSEGSSSSRGVNAVVRPDGAIWVPFATQHDRKSGTHTVKLTSNEWGSIVREFTPRAGTRIDFQFVEPSRSTVVIAGYAGSAIEGRVKVGIRGEGETATRADVSVDGMGRAILPPLAPGSYELSLRRKSRFHNGPVLSTVTVNLTSGEREIPVAIPALHSLTVELSGDVGGRRVSISGAEHFQSQVVTPDENGRVEFDLLPAGEYTVNIYGGTAGTKKVTIPGTTHVTF